MDSHYEMSNTQLPSTEDPLYNADFIQKQIDKECEKVREYLQSLLDDSATNGDESAVLDPGVSLSPERFDSLAKYFSTSSNNHTITIKARLGKLPVTLIRHFAIFPGESDSLDIAINYDPANVADQKGFVINDDGSFESASITVKPRRKAPFSRNYILRLSEMGSKTPDQEPPNRASFSTALDHMLDNDSKNLSVASEKVKTDIVYSVTERGCEFQAGTFYFDINREKSRGLDSRNLGGGADRNTIVQYAMALGNGNAQYRRIIPPDSRIVFPPTVPQISTSSTT